MSARTTRRKLAKVAPRSKMVFPDTLDKQLQYIFWRAFTPVHPLFRELWMPVRRMRKGHGYRQHYLLGTLAPGKTFESLVAHLVSLGYRRHPVAWRDSDELLSLRHVVDFDWQYHIRIFDDGEVRGHYELTPESYPFSHLAKHQQEERREEFLRQLGDWIVPSKISH